MPILAALQSAEDLLINSTPEIQVKSAASSDGIKLDYATIGSGDPLVFLHGAGGATIADPFLAKLAAKYHLYAPLLPGFKSDDVLQDKIWRFSLPTNFAKLSPAAFKESNRVRVYLEP